MKHKRIIAAAVAAVMCGTFAFTAAGCGEKCDHVYNWTVKKQATCIERGSREGLCGICGDVKTEEIPIDPDNHTYGEWEIKVPTEENGGEAVKKCVKNSSHTPLTVNLPALTADDDGYESEMLKYPTQLEEGEKQLTYKHETGDIVFTVPVSIIGVVTVADAVAVGTQFAHLVRKSYGNTTIDTTKYAPSKFYYEFGENYTHIIDDGDNKEIWYTLDNDGNPFGVESTGVKYDYNNGIPTTRIQKGSEPKIMPTPDKTAMQGFSFTFGYAGILTRYYGAEGVLSGVYEAAKASTNNDFKEEIIQRNGTTVYSFSFGSVSLPNYFSNIVVEFTLSQDYSVKTLVINSYAYDNTYEEKWVYDEELGQHKAIADEPSGIEYVEYNQISVSELSEEERDNLPVSPYDKQKLSIKSFDLKRGNNIIADGTPAAITADQAVIYEIVNVENFGEGINSLSFDPIRLYERTENGDVALSESTKPLAFLQGDKMTIRFFSKGESTIVLKADSGYEKVVVFNVAPKAPMFLNYEARIMDINSTSYMWTSNLTTPVYVGQQLHFRSKLSPEEENYADSSYTAVVTSSNKNSATITQSDVADEMIFTATAPGRYTVEMTSKSSSIKTCSFVVNVENIPTAEYLLGEGVVYTGDLVYTSRGKVTVTVTTLSGNQGFLTVALSDGSKEQLKFNFENGKITSEHSGGADLGFKLTLNTDCRLVLSHTLEEFDGLEESVILVRS